MSIMKTGALYFALVFAAGWVLGPIRELWVIPHLGRTAAIFLEAPLMVMVMIIAARWTIRRHAVPNTLKTRAGIGLIALGMLLVAEIIGMRWVRGLSLTNYIANFDPAADSLSILLFLLFAAMPMLVERW